MIKSVVYSTECPSRFDSGYELSENMNQDQREFYFKSNLFQLMFAIIFEVRFLEH